MENLLRPFLFLFFIILFFQCKKDNCATPSTCQLTPEIGPCYALIPKYYFDQASGECKEFSWGGCEGKVPFDTLEACEICECNQ